MKKTTRKSPPGRLRIVAGNWRSRLLPIADVPGLRPTSERVRETLFNWIGPRVHGSRCLDLFAGTGALGLEALSRGAESAELVEKSARAIAGLKASVQALDATSATVRQQDAWQFLEQYTGAPFDLIFLDPPFADESLQRLCRLIDEKSVLASGGRVYLEQDRSSPEPALPAGWTVIKSKSTGNVRYSLVGATA